MDQVSLNGVRVLFKLDELVNSHFSFSSDSFFNIVAYYIYIKCIFQKKKKVIEVQVIYLLFMMIRPLVMSNEFPSGCKLTVSPDFLSTCK